LPEIDTFAPTKNNTLMKSKPFLFIFTFFIYCAGVSTALAQGYQVLDGDTINRLNAKGEKTGYWEEVIGDFNVKGSYYNNVRDGMVKMYNASRILINLESYDKGKKNGLFLSFENSGNLVSETMFKNDLKDGEDRQYSYGSVRLLSNYKNGKLHGLFQDFYDNHKIKQEFHYVDGVKSGEAKWFDLEGKMTVFYNYKNGQLDGVQKTFYSNGNLQTEEYYLHNIQDGPCKEFYENGKLNSEGFYKNEEKSGTWKTYDETGKLIKTEKFLIKK
jgi:antitoxin component YwqK of YwqJK toxin-antitoxin module